MNPAPARAKRVPLRPEPPKKLAAGSLVRHAQTGVDGKVTTVLPGERFAVAWDDYYASTEPRRALLSRFTTTTPKPRKKASR